MGILDTAKDVGKVGLGVINPAAAIGQVGAAGVNAIGNAAQSAADDMPTHQLEDTPGMDQQAQAGADAQAARAGRGLSDFASDITQGTGQAANGLLPPGGDPMGGALAKRADQTYQRGLGNVNRNAMFGATGRKFAATGEAMDNAVSQHQAAADRMKFAASQLHKKQTEWKDREAAKNQVISAVLGTGGKLVGAAVGAYFGGGAGAKAGAMAGGALGDASSKLAGADSNEMELSSPDAGAAGAGGPMYA